MLERKHTALLEQAQRQGRADADAIGLVFRVLALASAIDRDCAARLGRHRLSEGRFVLLFLLASAGAEGLPPSRLAERAGVTRATVTALLDGLERDGLVERARDAGGDRRAVRVRPTPRGRALAGSLVGEHAAWIAGLTRDLTAGDRDALAALLAALWRRTDEGLMADAKEEEPHAAHRTEAAGRTRRIRPYVPRA